MICLFDDFLDNQSASEIEDILLGSNFPWTFLPDVTHGGYDFAPQKKPAFLHLFFEKDRVTSPYYDIVSLMINRAAIILKKEKIEVIRAKAILQLPLSESLHNCEVDTPHIDINHPFKPHLVLLYYVIDNDAETIIYSNKIQEENKNNLIECVRIKPRKGRLVIFDGAHLHTAEQPKEEIRSIININITG